MSWSAIRLAVIVLEVIGILLLSALLVTPAHKHAIVNAIIVAAVLRNVSAVVPMFAYEAIPEQFQQISQHPALSRFCGTFGVLLRYLTVVKAGFAVSFTLPLLYLAVKNSRTTDEPRRGAPFRKRTIVALCVTPFIWALPTVFIPFRRLEALSPQFHQACHLPNALIANLNPRRVFPMETTFAVSVVWEAITPIIMFFIFGAHEEVFEVWTSWYYQMPRPPHAADPSTSGRTSPESLSVAKATPTQQKRFSLRQTILGITNNGGDDLESALPLDISSSRKRRSLRRSGEHRPVPPLHTLPRKILLRPLSSGLPSPTHTPQSSTGTVISLPPPPRPARSRSASPDVTQTLNQAVANISAATTPTTATTMMSMSMTTTSPSATTAAATTTTTTAATVITPPPVALTGRRHSRDGGLHRSTSAGIRNMGGRPPSAGNTRLTIIAESPHGGSRRPTTANSTRGRPDTAQSRRPDTAQSRRPNTAQSQRPDTAQSSRTFGTFGTLGTLGTPSR
ncbi:hypothetical protein NLI96_g2978 [Meripilus lineatus]|uniref:Uncharacterized protein n=1 Tax=Meripilus lineatus TaxID=2056292 RepID=A0AAD5V7P1_9APHY|nr:hypothetical protein NLI96_g2978 [Physisporinus lineatus]